MLRPVGPQQSLVFELGIHPLAGPQVGLACRASRRWAWGFDESLLWLISLDEEVAVQDLMKKILRIRDLTKQIGIYRQLPMKKRFHFLVTGNQEEEVR